ncbi:MAG: DUF1501 domain-containing protein [Verrucomicrobia bacterium]|nr:DUF1501 domain-containing protein [Verrucomicrobiota bacterium]
MSRIRYNCAGLGRRDFLQLGLGMAAGLGFTDLLRLRASAAEAARAAGRSSGKRVNVIMIWQDGGPSHYESFDPKPDSPSEIRGQFKSIPTRVPGIHFSEGVPELAKVNDKFTVLRSLAHKDPNHGGGNHYLMTGAPTPVPLGCGAFVTFHPSFGSVLSFKRGVQDGIPPYMTMPSMSRSGGPNFLGAEHAPFVVGGSPQTAGFKVRDLVLPADLSEGRGVSRQDLRKSLDRLTRIADAAAEDPTVGFDRFYEQGVDLITSPQAQAAFDIGKEDQQTRDLYGMNDFGQRCLLARRLVEAGVSWVTVYSGGWDHHTKIFETLKGQLGVNFDKGVAALIADLDRRGSLENTLVLALGEFGRTPKVNKDVGRDHWPFAMSVLCAGAGVPRGAVIGATDPKGYYAADNVYSPEDFATTLYTKLGVDAHQVLHTNTGRPVQLVNGGRPIKELFS